MERVQMQTMNGVLPDLRQAAAVVLYGFAFFAPWSISGGQIFQLLLLLVTFAYLFEHGERARREPLVWLTVAFCAYIVVRGYVAVAERPDLAADHWDGAVHWFKSGPLAIVVVAAGAACVGNWRYHLPRVLGVWLLGICLNLVRHDVLPELLSALDSTARKNFGLQYIEAGVVCTSAILVVVAFAPTLVSMRRTRRGAVLAVLAAFALIGFLGSALIATGTRTTWIAGTVALVVMAALGARIWYRNHARDIRNPAAALTVGLALLLPLGVLFVDRLERRITPMLEPMAAVPGALLERDIESLERNTLTQRAALWSVAARAFADRPLFGHGPADVRYLLNEYPRPPQFQIYTHLHSGYSTIFNRFGIVGALPIVLLFLLVFRDAARLVRERDGVAESLGVLAVGFTVSMLVVAIAEQRFEDFHIVQVYSMIVGMALAPGLTARLQPDPDPPGEGSLH